MKRPPIDPELLRDRLREAQGKHYWRSLEELADDPAFQEMLQREFPDDAGVWKDGPSRRRFLSLMGASLALAGLTATGCRPPAGKIMPYVRQPEQLVLGKPLYFATAMTISGFATGLLVESHEGRPTKIEGNPDHPASKGATSAQHQAAILGLYDPDRSQSVQFRTRTDSWDDLINTLRQRLAQKGGTGKGLAVLSELIGSPTLRHQRDEFLSAYPEARWYIYEPVNRDNIHEGTRLAFGQPYHYYHKIAKADVIIALDADFLGQGPTQLAYTREFTSRRRGDVDRNKMNRLYAIETDVTVTGANADNRLALKPSQIETFARALANKLRISGAEAVSAETPISEWVDAIVTDLRGRAPGTTLVMCGPGQPPAVHAIVHAINKELGNLGNTVVFTSPLEETLTNCNNQLDQLLGSINKNEVHTLLILGGNPAYAAPANLPVGRVLREKLEKLPADQWLAVHLGQHFDETARLCHWHIPESHFLEQWSDAVAFDGTVSVVQPLIAPLYNGKSVHEVIAALTPTTGEDGTTGYDERPPLELIRAYWKTNQPPSAAGRGFEQFWKKTIQDGVMAGTAWPTMAPTLRGSVLQDAKNAPSASAEGYELLFAPDPAVYDGRFANNGWLQEFPKPVTRLTWDNALMMSPATAKALGVRMTEDRNPVGWKAGQHGDAYGDYIEIKLGLVRFQVPAWIEPGHADGALTLHLGYGRTHGGKVCAGAGFNANQIRPATPEWFIRKIESNNVVRLRRSLYPLACVQAHHSMEGRTIVVSGSATENLDKESAFRKKLAEARHEHHAEGNGEEKSGEQRFQLPTLYPNEHTYDGYKWGMAVDLSACTGCGACVVACQSENNSPIVGKEQVLRGREMHWLRIDRYFETPAKSKEHFAAVQVHFQPVLCQHCENAPCEVVCPVEATVHGDEGTNDMIYNRCVGTRYCANNCPYKVRRFNFLQFANYNTPSLKLMYNPDVTVRSRGVMEKCTFCIQRIASARIEAAKEAVAELSLPEDRRKRTDRNGPEEGPRTVQGKEVPYIRDGEILTACQSACPAEAIIFGDLNDKASRVHKLFESTLGYDLLGELGTRPRLKYLASVRNPNPTLEVK